MDRTSSFGIRSIFQRDSYREGICGEGIFSRQYSRAVEGFWKDEVYKQVIEGVRGTPSLVIINPEFYRPNDVELLHGDSSRARAELGWSPRYSFDDLVREMVKNDLREVGL